MQSTVITLLGETPPGTPTPVGGGCIHQAHRWGNYFIKSNKDHHAHAFACEANGLRTIAATQTLRTPEVIATGHSDGLAVLILEHLELRPSGDEVQLGEQLAALHRTTSPTFGFCEDNYIGSTPQTNTPSPSWASFFSDNRLGSMFDRLQSAGVTFRDTDRLLKRIDELVPKQPTASLLHGDLWSGNRAFLPDGSPVIFDPACYYGDAACDIAMTRLFGGYSETFYDAYRSNNETIDTRSHIEDLYNLYHILNHALLFGGTYINQATQIIRRLL